jgi:hypothetical protein
MSNQLRISPIGYLLSVIFVTTLWIVAFLYRAPKNIWSIIILIILDIIILIFTIIVFIRRRSLEKAIKNITISSTTRIVIYLFLITPVLCLGVFAAIPLFLTGR